MSQNDNSTQYTLIWAVLSYGWIAFVTALLGIFHLPIILALHILALIVLWRCGCLQIARPARYYGAIVLVALLTSFFVVIVSEPSVYSGRDEGSLSSAAALLADHGTISSESDAGKAFFDIYGPGKALNFPGFHYTTTGDLTSQFPLPYITFLAGFYAVFGNVGFAIANATLLFLFITSSALVVAKCIGKRSSIFYLALLLTSFPVLWFAKFTLSENLAGALIWSVILLFFAFREKPSNTSACLLFLALVLLLFTRIEGIWFGIIITFLVFRSKHTRAWLFSRPLERLWIPGVVFTLVSMLTLLHSVPFYKTLIGSFLPSDITSAREVKGNDFATLYIPVYIAYNLLLPLLCTACAVAFCTLKRVRHPFVLIIAICAPVFFYFLDPQISSDHPWMLRRFVWVLVPIILAGSVFLGALLWQKKQLRVFVLVAFVMLVLCNLFATLPYIMYAPNRDLNEQVETISQQFSADDLVLLAPDISGDHWAMLGASLRNQYGIEAVYFFNAQDYDKMQTDTFTGVYLITTTESANLFDSLIDDLPVKNSHFITWDRLVHERDTFTGFPRRDIGSHVISIYQLK